MLTGWMGKADLLKGWASQSKRKDRPASEARGKGAGEQAYFKHLKVRTEGRTLRISALFNRNVPDGSALINGRNQFHSWGFPQASHSGPSLCRTAGSFRFDIENEDKIKASFRLCFDIVAITTLLHKT